MNNISRIYVDMDGVIANFEKCYSERYGYISETQRRTQFITNFIDFIATKQFETLELLPDGQLLIDALNSLDIPKEILSSYAHENNELTVPPQKEFWLAKHNITWPQNFVPGKDHKYKWARPDTIIIDDTLSVIEDWRRAGGIAIHHTDAATTLVELSKYL